MQCQESEISNLASDVPLGTEPNKVADGPEALAARPTPGIPLLEDKSADLEIRLWGCQDSFELRFLGQPRDGETLVITHCPDSSPRLSCFSSMTGEDVDEVLGLIQSGEWQVVRKSEEWALLSPETPDPDEDRTSWA